MLSSVLEIGDILGGDFLVIVGDFIKEILDIGGETTKAILGGLGTASLGEGGCLDELGLLALWL